MQNVLFSKRRQNITEVSQALPRPQSLDLRYACPLVGCALRFASRGAVHLASGIITGGTLHTGTAHAHAACFVCATPLIGRAGRSRSAIKPTAPVAVAKGPRVSQSKSPPQPQPPPRLPLPSRRRAPVLRFALGAAFSLLCSRGVDARNHEHHRAACTKVESQTLLDDADVVRWRQRGTGNIHEMGVAPTIDTASTLTSTALAFAPASSAGVTPVGTGEADLVSVTSNSRGVILFAVGMFIVGAALAGAETAITTLWPWKVRELAEKEGPSSPFAVLDADLTRFLTTILVTTTASTVFSTAIATDIAGEVLPARAMGYFTAALTVFFLFFGEILPKALAVHSPAQVARVMVPVIGVLSRIVFPVGQLLAMVSSAILRILKVPRESDGAVSEQELRLIVAGADRSGAIEKYESEIIENVLDLEQKDVREVMCPRVDIVAVEAGESLAGFLELERDSRYSRMPVFDGNIDNVVGFVYAKDLLRYLQSDPAVLEETTVEEIMDPAFFVMESISVWAVLEQMRKRRLHLAVVVDEWGGTAGLVTLEDILEEVVGEILDEDDDDEAAAVDLELIADGRYVIEGNAELDKVLEELQIELPEDEEKDYGTISGLLCAQMGTIPNVGDSGVVEDWRFEVREADDRRILSLFAVKLTQDEINRLAQDESDKSDANFEVTSSNGVSESVTGNSNGASNSANASAQKPSLRKSENSASGGLDPDRR